MALGGGNGIKLDFTPTWIVAGVCLVIVSISFAVERFLHYLGKVLKRKNKKPLYEALLKVKEELMLLGFISLMLVAFQGLIQRICIPKRITGYLLPCDKDDEGAPSAGAGGDSTYLYRFTRCYGALLPLFVSTIDQGPVIPVVLFGVRRSEWSRRRGTPEVR